MKFVFDLDGTICFKGQPVSKKILRSLSKITKEGHEVIFASARPFRDMLPVIDKNIHHYTMIGGNGSLILKDGEIICSKAFAPKVVSDIKKLIDEYQASYLIDGEWDYAYTGPNDHPILQNVDPNKLANLVEVEGLTSIIKILLLSAKQFDELEEKLSELDVFVNKHRNENVLDISPNGINKWRALQELGVEENNFIAFGNDANDIPMFEKATHSVMVGYHNQLSFYAKDVIGNNGNQESEIVDKIEELLLDYKFNVDATV